MPLDLTALTANADVVERMGWSFDLRVEAEPYDLVWFAIEGIEKFPEIGRDGSGGLFLQLPDQRILFASSEGAAGVIATDLDAFVELIVAHPYWRDILKFSGGGKLDEMRRAAIAMEAFTQEEEEDLDEARDVVRSELGLAAPDDAVGALHRAVSTSNVPVRALSDGTPAASLFGTFTIDDNPMFESVDD
jgi:hypothetical protein